MARPTTLSLVLAFLFVFVSKVHGNGNLLSYLDKVPSCAFPCFSIVGNNSTCNVMDTSCLCDDTSDFHRTAQHCILETCGLEDAFDIQKLGSALCNKPERRRNKDILITLVLAVPAWLCVWARLYSRWLTVGTWGADDWIILVVGFVYTGFASLGQYLGQVYFGVDVWTLDKDKISMALKLFYADESLYILCLGLSKISVLCVYLRVFPTQGQRYAIFAAMALVALPTIALIGVQIFQCTPISLVWEGWKVKDRQQLTCVNTQILALAAAGISIFQDVVILVLPMPMVYKLRMHKSDKGVIIFMFSLGVFITATSAIRLQYIIVVGRSLNPTWDYVDALIWTSLEVSVAVVVACVPAVGVLLRRWIPALAASVVSATNSVRQKKAVVESHLMRKTTSGRRSRETSPVSSTRRLTTHSERLDLGDQVHGKVQTQVSRNRPSYYPFNDSYFDGPDQGISIKAVTKVTTTVETLPK